MFSINIQLKFQISMIIKSKCTINLIRISYPVNASICL